MVEGLVDGNIVVKDWNTTGGDIVTIRGNNFGDSKSCRVVTYSSGCDKCEVYFCDPRCGPQFGFECPKDPHSEIKCRVSPGIGTDLRFKVEVGPEKKKDFLGDSIGMDWCPDLQWIIKKDKDLKQIDSKFQPRRYNLLEASRTLKSWWVCQCSNGAGTLNP